MKVGTLIEMLEGVDEDAEVRLAHQPSWPLQFHVGDVYEHIPDDAAEDGPCDPCKWDEETGECSVCGMDHGEWEDIKADTRRAGNEAVVWISEGGQVAQSPYLPQFAAQGFGWK
jgi:hypothetical protein